MTTLPVKEPEKPTNLSHLQKLRGFFEGNTYVGIIMGVIVCDFIIMGLITLKLGSTVLSIIGWLDYIIQAIFILDSILQIYTYRCSFFKDAWKIIDLLITIITTIPLGAFSQYSKFIRSIRVIRGIRAISHIKYLRFLIQVLGEAIPQVAWTLVIQLIVFYCYSVLGTTFFGEQFKDWFGSIGKSLYSLFQIMTLESWSMGIARPVIAVFPYAWIYFVTFVIISSFIMMNIVVGIIVNAIQSNSDNEALKEMANTTISTNECKVLLDLLGKVQDIENTIQIVIDEKAGKGSNDNSVEMINRNSIRSSQPVVLTDIITKGNEKLEYVVSIYHTTLYLNWLFWV